MSDIYIAYIDGFNLFYKIKELNKKEKINLKWLNLKQFILETVGARFKKSELKCIKYFTAHISEDKKESVKNQQTYLEALQTLSDVEIIKGKFKTTYPTGYKYHKVNKKLFNQRVTIKKPEEKESDVNMAIHIINDCHKEKNLKGIVLVTSDTDFTPVLKMVKKEFKYIKIMIVKRSKKGSISLRELADLQEKIQVIKLKKSQFPDTIKINNGKEIKKPKQWND